VRSFDGRKFDNQAFKQHPLGSPMRRYMMVVVGVAALVAGCGVFSAHSDVIETAAGQDFTAERLADILTRIRAPMQYDTKTGTFVTALWTDMTLFAQAAATGKITNDSAFVAEAMWPTIVEATYTRWMDTVLARRANISAGAIDSAYKADKARAVQHVLIKADSGAPKEVKDIAHRKIEAILAQLKGGASFSKIAYDNTEDLASKPDSGFYSPKIKGVWMPSFDKALWDLKPGEMSGIVTTPYGYHIIRRPTEAESARFWRDSLARATAEPIITAYYAEVGKENDLKVDANAIPHMRGALDDRPAHAQDKTALATYKGGAFTVGDFVRWIDAALADPSQGPDRESQLKQAPDSQFKQMVTVMSQQALVLSEAKKNNVHLTADEWKSMREQFAAAVDSLKADIGLTGPAFDPKTTSASDRSKAAAVKVDEYFNDLVSQKKKNMRPVPGTLAAVLREHYKVKFNAVALQHGLDLAKTKHAADSVKAAGTGAGAPETAPLPGDIKPATGGPPTSVPPTPPPAPKKP
jgi:hypothetical protein